MGAGSGGGGKKYFNKQKKGRPRNNQKQNEQTDAVASRLKLTKDQQQELHRIAQLENWGYREIYEFAKVWFGK